MMRRLQNERGIALAVAIFALVVIGALVAGAFYVGTQEQRVGRNTVLIQQAMSAAEAGAYAQVTNWDATTLNFLPIDSMDNAADQLAFAGTLADGSGRYQGTVRRLNDQLFLVESEGFSQQDRARQRVGILARLRPIELDISAGLTTQGIVDLDGQGQISGADAIPPNWTGCPLTTDTLPAILIDDATGVTESPNNQIVLEGGVQGDPSIDATSLTTFGDTDFDELKYLANKILVTANFGTGVDPVVSGGACQTGVEANWGEPNIAVPGSSIKTACLNYFPVIYSDHDIVVNGRKGQGILIVDGDLTVQGSLQFNGPVIVRGTVTISGAGGNPANFYGGIIAANVVVEDNSLSGNANINFSQCAITRALNFGSVAWPLQERGWVGMY
jgi:hypothetical protein